MWSELTFWPEDSLARTLASSGGVKASRAPGAGYGLSTSVPFALFDLASSSWRTFQDSLAGEWTPYSESWPSSGTMLSGKVYRRRPLVPRTFAGESSLWPTPVAKDDGKTPEAHLAMKSRMKGGPRKTITSLQVAAKAAERGFFPTPRATDGERGGRRDLLASLRGYEQPNRYFPTPTANRWVGLQSHGKNVVSGQLNPTWVEWLMGFPEGWTDLEDSGTQ